MKVGIIGSGGREHSICLSLKNSSKIDKLFCFPGNAGTKNIAENVNIDLENFENIRNFIINNKIDLIVVGPEKPLVEGLVDYLERFKIKVFGPNKFASQLEGSKIFTKQICKKFNIPTAKFGIIENEDEAKKFLKSTNFPTVIKVDGLAAGKGVIIVNNKTDAIKCINNIMSKKMFGSSGKNIIIEEFIQGEEISFFALVDINGFILPLTTAQDHKKIGEGDTGLNTGGMGAVSPVPFMDEELLSKIENKVIKPTIDGIINENMEYTGFVFIGLIKVNDEPYVIEYNVRMGDPETEVVFPRIKNDIVELLGSMGTPKFNQIPLEVDSNHAATVILVSGGYPEEYEKEKVIKGLDTTNNATIFHAGTKKIARDFITNGGRVLAITSMSEKYQEALKMSYNQIKSIGFDKMSYRKDIGFDL